MSFQCRQLDDEHAVVTLAGRIDVMSSHILRANFELIGRNGIKKIIVDLDKVTFIDGSGLSALVAGLGLMRGRGGTLVLANPGPVVVKTLRATDYYRFFGIFEDLPGAVLAVKNGVVRPGFRNKKAQPSL